MWTDDRIISLSNDDSFFFKLKYSTTLSRPRPPLTFFFLVFHWSVRRPIDTRRDRDHYVDVDLRLRPTSTTTEGVGERSTNVPESRHVSRLVAALVFCFFVFNLGRSDSQSERPEWTHLGGRVYWVNFYFFNTHRLGFILLVFIGCHRVGLDSAGFHSVLLGFTGFYTIFFRFYCVLLGFIGFYWV